MSLYEVAVPAYLQILRALKGLLTKAEAHIAAQNITEQELLEARLAPDMLPLSKQIQLVCDHAGRGCARLTNSVLPSTPDTETTIVELKQRLENAIAFVNTFTAHQFEGAESRQITFPIGPDKTLTLSGSHFLANFNFPNFYFHAAIAHGILRSLGVEIGKRDFLGVNSMQPH